MKLTANLAIIVCSLLLGCDMIEYHPYDTDLNNEHLNINNKQIARITALPQDDDTIRFVWMGDTQRFYEETEDFVFAINQRNDIDFVLHGGDLTDYGMKQEYIWMSDIMNQIRVPHVVIVGNHDLVGLGLYLYECIYGEVNFSFVYSGVKFLCLNTNVLGFDYTFPVPDFDFIKKELVDSTLYQYDKTIAAFHAEPGGIEFNNNVEDYFHSCITQSKNLLFCLHAHAHKLKEEEYFDDGIIYYGCDDIESRTYMEFTITNDNYSYKAISF